MEVPRRLWVPRIQRRELHEAGFVLDEDIGLDDLLVLTPIGRAVLVAREITATLHELLEMQKWLRDSQAHHSIQLGLH